jgi:hypothetical protein
MIALPDWIPAFVRPLLRELDRNPACKGQRRVAFERLISDKRMKPVYDQFLRRNRNTTDFFFPARERKSNQTPEQAQLLALREVLRVAVSSAGDRISVSKQEQLDDARKQWGHLATQLRALAGDLALASEHGQLGLSDHKSRRQAARDIVGLIHVANWLDHQSSALRLPGDPLLVKRHRGNPIARAVQTLIGKTLKEQFGGRLDGIAATLAGAVLDVKTSARVSRSALTARKPKKKRTAR